MELRAMGSTMVSGSIDPAPVLTTIKVQHRIQINATLTGTPPTLQITTSIIANQIPGTAAAWDNFRLMKIDVWGPDEGNISVFMNGSPYDGAQFTDWGTPGNRRCQLHIAPNFQGRQNWQTLTGAANQFLLKGSTTTSGAYILNLTLELQSEPLVLPQLVELYSRQSLLNESEFEELPPTHQLTRSCNCCTTRSES
jgi:hypothetical protein